MKKPSYSSAQPSDGQKQLQLALLDEFSNSRARNPQYSLRAFARRLNLSASAASEIISGKRRVSVKLAAKILEKLNTDPTQLEKIVFSIKQGKSKTSKKKATQKSVTFLPADRFKIVSDWYHFAILSLLETQNAQSDSTFLSSRLGVPVRDIEVALERLERLQMLRRTPSGTLVLTGEEFQSSDGIPSSAVRASHSMSLDMAKDALENVDMTLRDITTETMAISVKTLPKARKLIRKFRTDLARLLAEGAKDEVYMLNVNLFPLSKK